jgi:hypothetical protein
LFIDCESDGLSFGGNYGGTGTCSGTFVRCRQVSTAVAGGILSGTFTGTAEDCYTSDGALSYSSGVVKDCYFYNGVVENRGLTLSKPTLANASSAGTTMSGTTTNTSTFSGTFTNTGAMGVSGATTLGSTLNVSGAITGTGLIRAGTGFSYQFGNRSLMTSPADGQISLLNSGSSDFTRLQFGGATAAFPAWSRTLAGITLTGGDGAGSSTNNLFVPGMLSVTNGLSSLDTTAAAAIDPTGYTNTLGKLCRVFYNGTAVTTVMKDAANTPYYTNAVALTGSDMIILQASEAIVITGTGVTGVRKPL